MGRRWSHLFAFACCLWAVIAAPVDAQQAPAGWSQPWPLSAGQAWEEFNALTTSSDGTVHIFWQSDPGTPAEGAGEPGTDNLWYAAVRDGIVETPVNILVPKPNAGMQRFLRAVTDQRGQVHLFFLSDPDCLEHRFVQVSSASSAHEWMEQNACVGETSQRFGVVRDDAGQLHIAYATQRGDVVYRRYSAETDEWSPPATVTDAKEDTFTSEVRIAVDARGRIHVAWSENVPPDFYPPTGVFYARSSDGGENWTPPQQLAGKGHLQPEILANGAEQIHIVWNGAIATSNRYHRFSNDGGRTWSPVHTFEIWGGWAGPPPLALDSAGRLHTVMAGNKGLFYATWTEQGGWSEPRQLWTDIETSEPAAVISGGNNLHVVFREAPQSEGKYHRFWYLRRALDAPPIPLEPTLMPLPRAPEGAHRASAPGGPAPTPVVEAPAKPFPRVESSQPAGGGQVEQAMAASRAGPVLLGVASAMLLIALVAAALQRRG
jgi:hypothetical protein